MTARHREDFITELNGTGIKTGQVIGGANFVREYRKIDDHYRAGDNNPLLIQKWLSDGCVLNKPQTNYFGSGFTNYVVDALTSASANATFGHLNVIEAASDTTAATQAAARTNPSRPYVDVGVNCIELADIVQLLQRLGAKTLREVGHFHLAMSFGVLPIVSDLAAILDYQRVVGDRVKEIQRLRSARGLRRTIDIGSWTTSATVSPYLQTQYEVIRVPCDVVTRQVVRAHCRWEPTVDLSHMAVDTEMYALARKAVLGLTFDAKTAWEGIPFSWLIDWCSSVGDYLAAQRNIVPAQLRSVTIMRHTETTWRIPKYEIPSQKLLMTEGSVHVETKQRKIASVLPTAHLPFLSASQMGILGSLAAIRT